jgi:hypothetical protein
MLLEDTQRRTILPVLRRRAGQVSPHRRQHALSRSDHLAELPDPASAGASIESAFAGRQPGPAVTAPIPCLALVLDPRGVCRAECRGA